MSLAAVAADLLAAGGRIMISPRGRLESAFNVGRVLDRRIPDAVSQERITKVRAYLRAERHDPGRLSLLVRSNGSRTANGWLVWEGC